MIGGEGVEVADGGFGVGVCVAGIGLGAEDGGRRAEDGGRFEFLGQASHMDLACCALTKAPCSVLVASGTIGPW